MKSIKFVSAVALAAGMLVMGSAQAQSNSGTLSFRGLVADQTCTITGGPGTNGEEGNISVTLDTVAPASLAAAGNQAGHHPFTLIVGGSGQGSCENGKVGHLTFRSAGTVDPVTGTMRNTTVTGGAANTNVQLTRGTATSVIDLNNPAETVDSTVIANNTATILLGAQYYATGAASAGLVNSNVQYVVSYN